MLAELAVPGESESLESGQRPVVEEPGRYRICRFRIPLDSPAAESGDQHQRASQGRSGHALAAVPHTDVAAPDPPVRELGLGLLVRRAVLDPGHLVGGTELAPARALNAVENEGGMGRTRPHPVVLALTVRGRVTDIAFGMHPHAPTAAEDTVIALHQLGEGRPRRIVEGADGVVGHALKLDPRSDTHGLTPAGATILSRVSHDHP